MAEHLSNCHGEWNALFALLGSLPFLGVWFRSKLARRELNDEVEAVNESR